MVYMSEKIEHNPEITREKSIELDNKDYAMQIWNHPSLPFLLWSIDYNQWKLSVIKASYGIIWKKSLYISDTNLRWWKRLTLWIESWRITYRNPIWKIANHYDLSPQEVNKALKHIFLILTTNWAQAKFENEKKIILAWSQNWIRRV